MSGFLSSSPHPPPPPPSSLSPRTRLEVSSHRILWTRSPLRSATDLITPLTDAADDRKPPLLYPIPSKDSKPLWHWATFVIPSTPTGNSVQRAVAVASSLKTLGSTASPASASASITSFLPRGSSVRRDRLPLPAVGSPLPCACASSPFHVTAPHRTARLTNPAAVDVGRFTRTPTCVSEAEKRVTPTPSARASSTESFAKMRSAYPRRSSSCSSVRPTSPSPHPRPSPSAEPRMTDSVPS